MKRLLMSLTIAGLTLTAHNVEAQSTSWNGPSCTMGAASFVVCSNDHDGADDPSPCYVSHFADYTPNAVQMKLIGLCQAAKAALQAPPDERANGLTRVVGRGLELNAAISADPSDAADSSDLITPVGHDLQMLGAQIITYSAGQSDDDWQNITDSLNAIVNDAQVWGG